MELILCIFVKKNIKRIFFINNTSLFTIIKVVDTRDLAARRRHVRQSPSSPQRTPARAHGSVTCVNDDRCTRRAVRRRGALPYLSNDQIYKTSLFRYISLTFIGLCLENGMRGRSIYIGGKVQLYLELRINAVL